MAQNQLPQSMQGFQPLTLEKYDDHLKSIPRAGAKLEQLIRVACMNALYHSYVGGQPDPANRLLKTVKETRVTAPFYQGVVNFLTSHGKLRLEGQGRSQTLVYDNKEKIVLEDKELDIPKQSEGPEVIQEFVQNIQAPASFKRPAAVRKPKHELDFYEELKKERTRLQKLRSQMLKAKREGNDVTIDHETALDGFLDWMRQYETENELVEPAPEDMESLVEKELQQLRDENSKLRQLVGNNQPEALELKDEGREPIQKVA